MTKSFSSTILSFEEIEEKAEANLRILLRGMADYAELEASDEQIAEDAAALIESAWETVNNDPGFDVYSHLASWADQDSCELTANVVKGDNEETLVFSFNPDGSVTSQAPEEDDEYDEDEDPYMDELCDRAWAISKAEGRKFDHVMGELLGGVYD